MTENLALALENLEAKDDIHVMWIDTVCVNRRDDDEKSRQVQMMRDIYERAAKVTVWLCPKTDRSDFAMAKIASLHKTLGNSTRETSQDTPLSGRIRKILGCLTFLTRGQSLDRHGTSQRALRPEVVDPRLDASGGPATAHYGLELAFR